MSLWKEFKTFAMRGNVLDMAVGIIIGAAFGSVVKSLVNDVIMPPIGLILGRADFSNLYILLKSGSKPGPYPSLAEARAAGAVTINYGAFINTVIAFLVVALAVFILVKAVNQIEKAEEAPPAEEKPETKVCPYCFSTIPVQATRCPYCTSELAE
jgi:large conductance mechanosensitive channel